MGLEARVAERPSNSLKGPSSMEIIIIIIIIIIIMPVRSNLYCVLILARTIDPSYRANRLKRPPAY